MTDEIWKPVILDNVDIVLGTNKAITKEPNQILLL